MGGASDDSALRSVFALPVLQRLAGPRSFERGRHYAWERRLKKLHAKDDEASAIVRGTHDYRVRLWIEDGGPAFDCSCPMGEAGHFCKHCVAVGLALTEPEDDASDASPPAPSATDLRSYLGTRDKEVLIDLILDRAAEDEFLLGRLELEAAKWTGGEVNLDAYREAIDDVIVIRDFVGYREMYEYSRNIGAVIASIRDLLDSGHAGEVITLCEHALEAIEDAWGRTDDSDGYMESCREDLVELHHDACLLAGPDPVALAERLFAWELHSEWETFYGAAERYSDVLGPEGLAKYRARAEEAWERVPTLNAGEDRSHSTFRFRIAEIMEALARVSDDVDALVAVKSRDLSSAYRYSEIVRVLREAGRNDDALEWAERGLAEFPDKTDSRLRELAAAEYHDRGRHDDAMALSWAMFTERPGLGGYQQLHRHAMLAGAWDEWREKALGVLRAKTAETNASKAPPDRWAAPADRSSLVEVFLWEEDAGAAWTEAQAGGCSGALWMRLAAAREADHPEDALPIYQDHVERTIQIKKNHAYAEAVEWMRKIRGLLVRLDRSDEFPSYAADVRARHKPKRNLMKLLDSAGW